MVSTTYLPLDNCMGIFLLLKFSFSEKATKIWNNLPLVLTLQSKNSCFVKTSGRFISKFVDFSQCFNCTQQQCGSMSKNHFAQFPDDRVHQKCKGKKLIMPDTLRIRCRTGIHIGTKACLKPYLTYHIIWWILPVLVKFIYFEKATKFEEISLSFDVKVHIFWEGHKLLRNLLLAFDCTTYMRSKVRWSFHKMLWSSQNI